MKGALAKMVQRMVDRLDPAAARDRAAVRRQRARALLENLELRERLSALAIVVPETGADWRPDQAAALRTFLESAHGQVLSSRLRSVVALNAITGARKTEHPVHAAGVSAGWDEAVRYLHSLSRVSGGQDTELDNPPSQDETALIEHWSP